tara:strand:- start:395252 stop:395452 length:201 start_codon:yes stop_codon:yes gene_type:complete
MNPHVFKIISLVALAVTFVPCLLYFGGLLNHGGVKMLALAGTIAWFIATPMWMSRKLSPADKEVEI